MIPAQSTGRDVDPGYAFVRLNVVRTALEAGLPLSFRAWPKRSQLPPLLPQVRGLRLFPRSGGADELALDQRLSALSGPARAVYVLRGLEKLPDGDVRRVLAAAGVDAEETDDALSEADEAPAQYELLDSPEFDPCSLHARPTDLMRRRQHGKAALAAAAAVAVCGALLAMPGGGWGPDGAAAPAYAQNPASQAALDPGKLTRIAPTAWTVSARKDFSAWPARGDLTKDTALLRRALAVWARPGESVQVSATPGTPSGGPAGPPQLLYSRHGRQRARGDPLRRFAHRPLRRTEGRHEGRRAGLRAGRRRDRVRGERGGAGPGRRQRPLSDRPLGEEGGRARPPEAEQPARCP